MRRQNIPAQPTAIPLHIRIFQYSGTHLIEVNINISVLREIVAKKAEKYPHRDVDSSR